MFTLDQVVPWGRSFGEYQRIFALTDDDLHRRILGCGDGPASFNAEATQRNCRVVSCDPFYRFDKEQIEQRIVATYDQVRMCRWIAPCFASKDSHSFTTH